MSRVLLDTSAYSAFHRGHQNLKEAIQEAQEIYLTPVVLGELHSGFRMGRLREQNERGLALLLESPRVGVVNLTPETAHRYAEILAHLRRRGKPLPTNDLWIAASAMEHGLRILTTDAHFDLIPQVSARVFQT